MKTKILRLLLTVAIMTAFMTAVVGITKMLSPEIISHAILGLLIFVLSTIVYQLVKDTIYPDKPTTKPAVLDYAALLKMDPIVEKPTEPKKRGRKPKTATTTTTKKKSK